MLKSMTGYGRGRHQLNGKEYSIEIRSVNHKYHDISVKMPRSISYLEEHIKKCVNNVVSRGKVEVSVGIIRFADSTKDVRIDATLAQKYINKLESLNEKLGLDSKISVTDIIEMPDVLSIIDNQDEEAMKYDIDIVLTEALDSFVQMRANEGEKIAEDLTDRINVIEENLEKISAFSTGLVEEYIVKLRERIKELLDEPVIDEKRIAMEAVIYADKCSIEEELTRLRSHIAQFRKMLKEEKPVGKRLDFLVQEMNRETNTIGAKANSIEITNIVVELKNEIENIREQIQNVE